MLHPNIVKFEHHFADKTNVYMILELCQNKSLLQLVKSRGKLNESETRFYMLQLLVALEYMHSSNVIHRDLKLANLFLSKNMDLKVGDFGLATEMFNFKDRKKTICGTPNYIAPEILDQIGHSFEVDVWALGVIMYTMLIGHPPFQTTNINEIYHRIKTNNYEIPESSVSTDARKLINSLLQTVPETRPLLREIMSHSFFKARVPNRILISAFQEPTTTDCLVLGNLEQMCDFLEGKRRTFTQQKSKIPVFIARCIDYTDKYGLGFQLTNGVMGVYFNDSTLLMLSPNQNQLEYLLLKFMSRQWHTLNDYPSNLSKKVVLLKYFKDYMDKHMVKPKYLEYDLNSQNNDFITKFHTSPGIIVFRISNSILQINYDNHTKLIFSNNGKSIFFVDKHRKVHFVNLLELLKSDPFNLKHHLLEAKQMLLKLNFYYLFWIHFLKTNFVYFYKKWKI